MKRLFLASVAVNTIERLVEMLGEPLDELTVAFIPNAADLSQDMRFVNEDREKLKEKGFRVKDVDITKKKGRELGVELGDADIIFAAGGNTFYLLEKARESGFDKMAVELVWQGVIYVGSSAGAVLACPSIEHVRTLDDPDEAPNLSSFDGLNLVDFLLLPHYGQDSQEEQHYQYIAKEYEAKGYQVVLLSDNQAVIVEDENYRIVD